jgi:hypothetical protein
VLENGEMLTPLATELENIEELLDGETSRGPTLLALSAFGEDVRAWTDERAYYASPDPREPDLASRSFVPAGLFGESTWRTWREPH